MGFFDLFKSKEKKMEEECEKSKQYEEALSEDIVEFIEEEVINSEYNLVENKLEEMIESSQDIKDSPFDNEVTAISSKKESVQDIVNEVVNELKTETYEDFDQDVILEVIHQVEDIEEEIAEEVLEEITESVEEIVNEVVCEITKETEEAVEIEVVNEVIHKVKDIENTIKKEIKGENPEQEEDQKEEKELEQEELEQEELEQEELEQELEQEEEFDISEPKDVKKGFFARLIEGLDKTRKSILGGVDSVLSRFTKIDEELFEELEEVLIMADIGVDTTMSIIENLRTRVKKEKVTDPQNIRSMLIDEIANILNENSDEDYELKTPTVLLVIGVNGVGKTTTIGKLANNFKSMDKKVLLGAADTFRAAAIDQLQIWGDRAGIDVIKHEERSDPAAVVFDAVNAAKNRNTDILICDTAGRLHNKKNLMDELRKISKVIDREYPTANKEVYLVLDATTGQNAMQQAKLFKEVADITGIILTKLDGTAKGGIVIAIKSELKIPVRYIGVGESIEDLQKFNAKTFAKALFGEE